ncbi:MAG: hypothetical protein IKC26_09295 [Clostridia bacterium]|nr:hypothetical protein [Clostridia bacterium]
MELVRSIGEVRGRISINNFTSEEIQKAEKWARKFYAELGTKSPFFRAWFGDWRARDATPLKIANIDKNAKPSSGNTINKDTGRKFSWSTEVAKESIINSPKAYKSDISYISANINLIVENAVLLDTVISSHKSKRKLPGSTWMHSLYSLVDIDGKISLIKLFAEEAYSAKSNDTFTRAYSLKYIEKVAEIDRGVHSENGGLTDSHSTTVYSISDLFDFVKRYDTEFSPKSVNPTMLNPDGTPKVFYHGTSADFTAFDRKKIGSNTDDGVYGKGFYFSSNRSQAEQYGGSKEYFLSLKNPLVLSDYHSIEELADVLDMSESNFSMSGGVIHPLNSYINSFTSHLQYAGYDGVIVDYGTSDEVVVFDSTQIKSATDNIGTFDGSNPDIRYSVRKSNRSTLTAALDSVVTDPEERRILEVYRANIENLDAQQERLQELNAEIKNLSFSDGAKDRARISELRQEAIKTQNRINLYDKKLLGLEAMAPMKRVVERQAQKAYEKAAERGRETLTKRRESINIHFLCRNYSFCVKK